MVSKWFMALSAGILILLGAIHLAYTFSGTSLLPRGTALQTAMEQTHLSVTKETTVWRAWIGFNASHSLALILFGLIFGYLALYHATLLFDSAYLLTIGFATLIAFLVLSKLYWFSIPFAGVGLSLLSYVASIIAART